MILAFDPENTVGGRDDFGVPDEEQSSEKPPGRVAVPTPAGP